MQKTAADKCAKHHFLLQNYTKYYMQKLKPNLQKWVDNATYEKASTSLCVSTFSLQQRLK